ncbi:STAS domain-containing protein [Dermacoccus nishinomiyaensis]|uniref:STAS domain-containing protein n=1 Tax=Dermacoccus TaxID=57495 RepID=UPI001AA15C2A|nr:STAS domain-containing protein [Dermacoccus nishinomiyaensis]MBO1759597.1 STAS domain-containing protein [Dermacoccus sp. NHGro5]
MRIWSSTTPSPGGRSSSTAPVSARTSDRVRTALHTALAGGDGDLVVHLANAQVWDAAGLGVIVGAHHRAERQGRRLVVADASPRLCRLLPGTRLDRVMNVSGACGYVPLARTA